VFNKLSPEMEKRLSAMFLAYDKEPTMEELRQAMLDATQPAATTYLIIDGLDECKFDDRNELLSFMNQLIKDSKSRVKITVSSQEKVDIFRSSKGFFHISLDSARNHSDVEIYVRDVVDRKLSNETLKVGQSSMAEEIKMALIQGSDGMYVFHVYRIPYWLAKLT
jgi:hypothetical protein